MRSSREMDRRPRFDALFNASFDRGDASDMSPYKRVPAVVGSGVTFTSRSAVFDGSANAVITYPDASELEVAPFTVAFWARISGSASRVSLVAKNGSGAYLGWYIHFIGTSAGSNGISVATNTNSTNWRGAWTGSPATYGDNTLRHYIATVDNINNTANWNLYVNGASVSLTKFAQGNVTTVANAEPLAIAGFTTPNQTARLNGAINSVIMLNRAITASEAMSLYSSEV